MTEAVAEGGEASGSTYSSTTEEPAETESAGTGTLASDEALAALREKLSGSDEG